MQPKLYEKRTGYYVKPSQLSQHRRMPIVIRTKSAQSGRCPEAITLRCKMQIEKVPLRTTLEAVVNGTHKGTTRMIDHAHFQENGHHLSCGVQKVLFQHTGQGNYVLEGETVEFRGGIAKKFHFHEASNLPTFIKSFAPIYQGLCNFDFEFLNRETMRNYSAGGRTNAVHLRPIGGSYRPGDSLKDIEPYYVSSFYVDGKPYPYFWGLTKMMRETGIRPPNGMRIDDGKYYTVFDQDGPPEWHKTLAESINMGDLRFKIEDTEGKVWTYKSHAYEQIEPLTVLLIFIPLDSD